MTMLLHFLFRCAETACVLCFVAGVAVALFSTISLSAASGASVLRRDGAWEEVDRENLGVNWTPVALCFGTSAVWGLIALALRAL